MTEKASFLCSFDLHVIFAPFLSHDARITPSKTNKNISKHLQNMNKLKQLIFSSLLNQISSIATIP